MGNRKCAIEGPKNNETILNGEHIEKNVTGRYIVKMPSKENPVCLMKSKGIALKKLNFL